MRQAYSRRRTIPSNEHGTTSWWRFTTRLGVLEDARLVLAIG